MQTITSIFYFEFLLLLTISLCHLQSAFGNHHFKNSFTELSGTTNPDCPSKCGNLTVPYPFGTGAEVDPTCSINPVFHLNCNSSFDPPKAFLGSDELEVLGIYNSEILVKNRLSYTCYYNDSQSEGNYDQNSASPANPGFFSMNLTGTPFAFSSKNKLTVVGCDDVAIMSTGSNDWDYSISSCVAICSKSEDLINGSCSGIGCCQSSIPKGLQSLYSSMITLTSHNKVKSFNPCGYSFLAGPGSYTFETSDVSDSPFGNRTLESASLLIDWAIGDRTCEQILSTNEMICEGESVCVDSGTGLGGYRCNCSEGYFGNPYLSPGCQDINECEFNPCHGKAMCINLPGSFNCSCRPDYVGDGTKNGTGCIYLPPPSKTALYAGLPAGLGLFLTLAMSFWLYKTVKKRRAKQQKRDFFKRNGGLVLHQQMSARDNTSVLERGGIFTSKELEKATDRFNESRILGRGGQGTVYKGMLSDGRIVAVKKSKQVNEGRLAEFVNEVVILSQINHRNVVRLLGCCLETEVPLLVYEFVPNGTLYHLIHEDTTGFPFSWDLRLRIAAEIANALAYLHYATSIPVYHRDMKSSNILLDEKYRAKLSDFGISRSVGIDVTHLTTKVKGTFGYLDPEYFQTSKFTEKSDVYSFGVVLVELLTGLKPILTSDETEEERSLVTRFLLTMKENRLKEILDSKIIEQGVSEEHTAVADVAKRCLNLSGKKRPNIREVAVELERIRASGNPSFVESNVEDMSCTETESFVISGTEFWLWS
ncbi:hypothetical protein ABFS82_01G020900 [Erythranthe guttata]